MAKRLILYITVKPVDVTTVIQGHLFVVTLVETYFLQRKNVGGENTSQNYKVDKMLVSYGEGFSDL